MGVRNVWLLPLAGVVGLLASFAPAPSAGAVTVTGATTKLVAGATGRIVFNAGAGSHVCLVAARSGVHRLGPLRYRVSQPLVVMTGRVPHAVKTLTWSLSVRCASSTAHIARVRAASVVIHVRGHRRGTAGLFSRASIHVRSYPAGAVVGAEPELRKGGKGGYDCGGSSYIDASSYCTGYCTWFVWQKRPEAQLKDLGNAWEWWDGAKGRGIPEGSAPVAGSVAWWGISAHAPEGHVAYVIGASGSSVTIEEMNRVAWDVADTRTISLVSSEAPNGYIYGGPAGSGSGSSGGSGSGSSGGGGGPSPTPGTPGAEPVNAALGFLDVSGDFAVKEALSGSWTAETTIASKVAMAPGSSGPVVGFLDGSGNLYVKEGIGGSWTLEATGASQFVLAAGRNGPLIAFIDQSGNLAVKEGIGGSWTPEATGASQVVLAEGAVGPVIGFLDGSGDFYVKEGLGASWTLETSSASKIALAPGATGPTIAFIDWSGNLAVKEGIGGSWTPEATGASQVALVQGAGGPVIGFLDESGNFFVKEGVGGTWTQEASGTTAIALGPGAGGPVIGSLNASGDFYAKEGVDGAWTTETTYASQIVVA
jgi:surface antigen